MKTLEEFKAFYSSALLSELEELEADRKSRVKIIIRNTTIYLVSISVLIAIGLFINYQVYDVILDGEKDNVPFTISIILSIIGIFILFGMNRKIKSGYTGVYKDKIVSSIVRFVHKDLVYRAHDVISLDDFCKSDIFKQRPHKYFGDDYVSGRIDKTDIAFSEVHAKVKVSSGDEDNREKWQDLFDGLFFKADFHKDFKGKYFVLPDFAEKSFGRLGKFFQKMNKTRGQLIHLEDPEFEKAFAVYGTDQVEGRYILSSNMMRRILEFKSRTRNNIYISFVDSCVYIAIQYKRNLFEPKFYSTAIDETKTSEYFMDLHLAVSIVEELNLNTRIWGKE